MTQKLTKKLGVNDLKDASVSKRYCRDCLEATIHQTGSLLWISCKLQSGWRDINSTCNLPEAEAHS